MGQVVPVTPGYRAATNDGSRNVNLTPASAESDSSRSGPAWSGPLPLRGPARCYLGRLAPVT
jgi:hypothetical protein